MAIKVDFSPPVVRAMALTFFPKTVQAAMRAEEEQNRERILRETDYLLSHRRHSLEMLIETMKGTERLR